EPPAATLALLDPAGQARVSSQWPSLSAPVRKSLVETLPSVPPAQRGAFLDQMDSYTKDMNGAIQQSMKLLQQAQQQMQQQGTAPKD
ncbi:MAG: hypothetical protein KGL53_15230, partial [Elusimicrobia bacterium]|nr:hypothetical protein [Elusimicrobiota bacterium]